MNKLEALTAVLQDPSRSREEKEIAARALRSVNASTDAEPAITAYQELTQDSQMMLQALCKKHLRGISEADFERYAHDFDPCFKELLCRQWREWVCPDDDFLNLIGLSRTNYWRTIYDHAKSEDVKAHARRQLAALL